MLANLLPLLRSLFMPSKEISAIEATNVKPLTNLQELDACMSESAVRPVFIFKHSTACSISAAAYRHVAKYSQSATEADPEVYIVKVIEDRPVSNQIADELVIQHKSPQLILVKDRAVVWSSSHYGINEQAIRKAVSGPIAR
jgi:bacillithiol system protein YtxJ